MKTIKLILNFIGWGTLISTVFLNAYYFTMMLAIYLQTGKPYAQIFQQEPTLWIFFTEFALSVFYSTIFVFYKMVEWMKSTIEKPKVSPTLQTMS